MHGRFDRNVFELFAHQHGRSSFSAPSTNAPLVSVRSKRPRLVSEWEAAGGFVGYGHDRHVQIVILVEVVRPATVQRFTAQRYGVDMGADRHMPFFKAAP